jgi:hypothetical protein
MTTWIFGPLSMTDPIIDLSPAMSNPILLMLKRLAAVLPQRKSRNNCGALLMMSLPAELSETHQDELQKGSAMPDLKWLGYPRQPEAMGPSPCNLSPPC